MNTDSLTLMNMRQVQAALQIRSRTTIYRMVAAKRLPPPCVINRRGLRWRETEIAAWVSDLSPRD
jgi:predicted DNA-binding transcriptional regulator AlpA